MKTIIQHQNYGEITYEESFWTGKKNLSVGGEALTKISKKEFLTSSDEHWTLKGNYLSGVVLNTGSEEIRLPPPVLKWYEIVLSVLPFILIMVWEQHCSISDSSRSGRSDRRADQCFMLFG